MIHDLRYHAFEKVKLGRRRVAVQQSVRLYVRHRWQFVTVDGREEIRRILDMSGPLIRVAHDRIRIRFKVANVAISRAHQHRWIGGPRIVLQIYRSVVRPAVIRPGDFLLVERFADGTHVDGRNRGAFGNAGRVNRAVRQEPGESLFTM